MLNPCVQLRMINDSVTQNASTSALCALMYSLNIDTDSVCLIISTTCISPRCKFRLSVYCGLNTKLPLYTSNNIKITFYLNVNVLKTLIKHPAYNINAKVYEDGCI